MTHKFTNPAWLCLAFLLLISTAPSQLSAQVTAQKIRDANNNPVVLLQYLPVGHKKPGNNRLYPLIIFLHGGGPQSNDTSTATGSAVWALTGHGPFRCITSSFQNKMGFTWNDQIDSFIVIAPLAKSPLPHPYSLSSINAVINYATTTLNIDQNRIFMTGHSYGGGGTFHFLNQSQANANTLAGALPVSAYYTALNASGKSYVKNARLPLWGFHAADDNTTNGLVAVTEGSVDGVNALNPDVLALKKIWPAGYLNSPHNDPINHTWNINPNGIGHPLGTDTILNIYEWFLGQNKSLPVNALPTANAGPDQHIPATPGQVTLNGTNSSDAGGGILRYVWKQLQGPKTVTINNGYTTSVSDAAQHATKQLTGLTVPGVYRFQLSVVDTRSAVSQDTVDITVSTTTGNAVTPLTSGNIAAGNVTQLNNASKFTLETWFKINETKTTYTTLFAKADGLSNRIMVHVTPNTNAIQVFLSNSTQANGVTASNTVSPGTWYHLAVVFDGTLSGNSNRLKVFLDGTQQSLTFTGTVTATTGTNSNNLRVGGELSCCLVDGTVDEVRVWSTALSSGTLNTWKGKLLGTCHPNIANLALYWPLDDNSNPTSAAPALGTAYTGTMANNGYVTSSQATAGSGCGSNAVLEPFEEVRPDKAAIGRIYPNPAKGLVQIELKATVSKSVTVNVLDMTGKYYYRNRTPIVMDMNRITINIASLPPGTYIVEISDGKIIRERYKIVKQ